MCDESPGPPLPASIGATDVTRERGERPRTRRTPANAANARERGERPRTRRTPANAANAGERTRPTRILGRIPPGWPVGGEQTQVRHAASPPTHPPTETKVEP